MAEDLKVFPVKDLSQGIFSEVAPIQIPPGGAQPGTNNAIWLNGYLRPRPGMGLKYGGGSPAPAAVKSLPIYKSPNQPDILFRMRYDSISSYSLESLIAFSPEISTTWSLNAANLNQAPGGYHLPWCNFSNKMFIAGLVDTIAYNGPTFTVESQQPNAAFKIPKNAMIVAAGDSRLFIADHTNPDTNIRVPHRLSWSDFGAPYTWNGGEGAGTSGFLDLPRDSRAITGVVSNSAGLMVFTARETYFGVFVGLPEVYEIRGYTNNVGCLSHETIRSYKDGSYIWLGDDNVYMGAPGQQAIPIGDKIRIRMQQVCRLDWMYKSFAVIDHFNNLYHLVCPSSTTNDLTLMFTLNIKSGAWWEGNFPNFSLCCGAEFRPNDWKGEPIMSGAIGKVLDLGFEYRRDIGLPFSVDWVSGVVAADQISQGVKVASMQWVRSQAVRDGVESAQLDYKLYGSTGLDNWIETSVDQPQVFDGSNNNRAYSSGKIESENFYAKVSGISDTFPLIAKMEVGFVPTPGSVR